MKSTEKRNSIGHLSVLAGLWFINILILIFGFPFLIYKKVKEIFFKTSHKHPPEKKSKSSQYFPCEINSKF